MLLAAARPKTAKLTPALPIDLIVEVIHVVAYFAALFEYHKYVALTSNYTVNGYNLYYAICFKQWFSDWSFQAELVPEKDSLMGKFA